jgi:hypothetical protein
VINRKRQEKRVPRQTCEAATAGWFDFLARSGPDYPIV